MSRRGQSNRAASAPVSGVAQARDESQGSADNSWDSAAEGDSDGADEDADAERRAAALAGSGSTVRTEVDPVDEERHLDEAARRSELTNMQTEHEAVAGLDAVSGTPNPGVTEEQSNAHSQPGDRGSDMAGNPPKPDPMAAVSDEQLTLAFNKLSGAVRTDVANARPGTEAAARNSAGWRTLRDLGVHKATMDALVAAGRVERDVSPGMSHMPETGHVYRLTETMRNRVLR